jgi:IS5 family transposase
MYGKGNNQITLAEFNSPFGKLDHNNRWVRIADMIPWQRYERKYAEQFCENNGAPAIRYRMAMGTLIIKQKTGHSDEEVLQDIIENPYLQYLIGLHEFTTTAPFAASSITNFRKYITKDMIAEINDDLFGGKSNDNDDDTHNKGGSCENDTGSALTEKPNKGKILLDATCTPANIAYPTDVNLLNEAREKLERIIDTLHPYTVAIAKPRTYRRTARRSYLQFTKQRKPRKETIRKAIKQQLQYVLRDMGHIDKQLLTTGTDILPKTMSEQFNTIRKLYSQQREMYENETHTVNARIVSINQPHVRPIVRGKTNASVEFGAKVSISLVGGYAYIDKLGWDAYNEEEQLIPALETYKRRYGYYPAAVLADKIYRNRANRSYCKEHGIRLSGPRLGRHPKETDRNLLKQERVDASGRNAIEGKFGEGKTKYGLNRIMARLKDSSETVIAMSFLCMNINRKLRVLFRRFIILFFQSAKLL